MSQCEKARNDLLLQQALMQGQGRQLAPSSSSTAAGQAMYAGGLPGVVQGVAIGLPAMQVRPSPCCASVPACRASVVQACALLLMVHL